MAQQLHIYHKVRADKKIKAFYTLLNQGGNHVPE
jgi:hypothetical protein